MQRAHRLLMGVIVLLAVVVAAPGLRGDDGDDGSNRTIALVDDCDPDDPAWAPIGCLQNDGDVTNAEFGAFLRSPLYDNIAPFGAEPGLFLVGHPSWRNEPSHISIEDGERIEVKNVGGRPHTFTEVVDFGGGRVPPLRVGTQFATECAAPPTGQTDPNELAPGRRFRITASGVGIHKFQCCFHPWMRATVRVTADDDDN
jgi:plastocyanin